MIFKQLGFPEKQNASSIVSETQQKTTVKKENIKIGHVLSDGGTDLSESCSEFGLWIQKLETVLTPNLQNVQLLGASIFHVLLAVTASHWGKPFHNMNEDLTRSAALHGMI